MAEITRDAAALRAAVNSRRRDRGYTIPELARRAGIDSGYAYKMLSEGHSDERPIGDDSLKQFAEALGTTPLLLREAAGLLSDSERDQLRRRVRIEDVIDHDPTLSDLAKRTLLGMLQGFRGRDQSRGAPPG